MLLTEKGNPFLLGANRTAEGYNFALDIPEGETVKLLLYKKGGKTPKYILPFPEDEKMGRVCAMEVKGISGEMYAREKNAGWRIDYFLTSPSLETKLADAKIHSEIMGSDHCPIELTINMKND